mmetsp:Transcript_5568/g.12686  ORF Transcript_5568/g.12686 Transcript_5568/m.12686 type:complete len:90 (-) Transcript_5568:228-497(-)
MKTHPKLYQNEVADIHMLLDLCQALNLWLDKGSVSNSKSNSERNNTGNKSSTVSDDDTLIDISGVGGKRSHGSGEGSNGGGIVVLGGGL